MYVDLHIHTDFSDGKINIDSFMSKLCSNYDVIAFTDHEHIFNPYEYKNNGLTKYLSGVEICCNHNGKYIEILGYNFDVQNSQIIQLVNDIKNLRVSIIKKILSDNGFNITDLPYNPFRINVPLPAHINRNEFWHKYNDVYKEYCHSVPAYEVIDAIISANGIPVLAHPMESLCGFNECEVERFVISLGIKTVEMITPKHSKSDIMHLSNIISRNQLYASIGSDSHQEVMKKIDYKYDINERQYEWIQDIVNKEIV